MKKIKLAFIVIATIAPLSGCANTNLNATVKVRVVDEDKQPIKGVHSKVMSMSTDDSNSKHGFTDINGMYFVHLCNIKYNISGYFNKFGYYATKGKFWSIAYNAGKELVPPANTNFVIVLKRIIDPVPMKYQQITTYFPRLNELIGFDLEVGDWVFPDGKGKIADMEFFIEKRFNSITDFDIRTTIFINGNDCGIQFFNTPAVYKSNTLLGSELPPPHTAPELGYEQKIYSTSYWHTNGKRYISFDENRNWIFRTRVIKDDKGNIVSANYGWINQDFMVVPTLNRPGQLSFSYYYNPNPQSRSLEPKEIADRQAKNLPKGED